MRLTLAVAGKEMTHILRDRRTLAIILILPTVLTFIFGYAFESGAIKGVRTAVLNHDAPSTLSLQIIKAMGEDETFEVILWDRSREEASAALDRGEFKAVVVLPKGLKADSRKGTATVLASLDGIDTASAPSVRGALLRILTEHGLKAAGLKFRDLGLNPDAAKKILEADPQLRRALEYLQKRLPPVEPPPSQNPARW